MELTQEQAYLIEQMREAIKICHFSRMRACRDALLDLNIIALPDGCGDIIYQEIILND